METQNEQKAKELIGCNPYSCKSSDVNFCQKTYHNGLMCKEKARLIKAMEWKEQQIIKRTIDWVQKEATKHIGFNAISEECSLSLDFIDLLVKAMKGE